MVHSACSHVMWAEVDLERPGKARQRGTVFGESIGLFGTAAPSMYTFHTHMHPGFHLEKLVLGGGGEAMGE